VSYYVKEFDDKVAELLKNGRVGLIPTDTIYGLSAHALNKNAVEKIHKLKGRDNRPMIVLVSDAQQLEDLGIKSQEAKIVNKFWPGALSVIFESSQIPEWLQRGTNSLAVRLPDLKELRDLIAKTGPLVSTSANLQGQEPSKNVEEAKKYFSDKLDFYVDTGDLKGKSSTLVKIENNRIKIIRQGACEITP
jgi:L-threonylcarbamoyladenylate synthase